MIWYDHLFLGRQCRQRANRLKYKIANRLMHPGVYLLVLPQTKGAVLEIIPSVLLLQENYPTDQLVIVGMAATKTEALGLVEEIVGKMYAQQGDFDLAAYCQIPECKEQLA